jgi:hypothetical protein
MTKRPSIRDQLQPRAEPVITSDVPPARSVRKTPAESRGAKVNISAYFPPEVKSSIRLVQAKRGGKVQDLLAEALNLLFQKYKVPEAAPTQQE